MNAYGKLHIVDNFFIEKEIVYELDYTKIINAFFAANARRTYITS